MLSNSLQRLRVISFIEGISYLLLLFVGMPLKYGLGIRVVNYILGMGHGILTMIFVLLLMLAFSERKLTLSQVVQVFVASLIPFGAFWAEQKFKVWMEENEDR